MSISKNPWENPEFIKAQKVEVVGGGLKFLTFPDGFRCYSHSSKEETELIYNEIFLQREYLGATLTLDECRAVFDVGANIGLFTIFVKVCKPGLVVHAFEPIKATYDVLVKNVELHSLREVYLHNYALGNEDGVEQTMTFFPNAAGNATSHPESKEELQRMLTEVLGQEQTTYFFQSAEVHKVQVRTLSSVMDEHGVLAVDLLKIDCESDEVAILQGISEEYYPMIRQIAVEVHSARLREEIQSLLASRGFRILLDAGVAGAAVAGDNNLVYAVRK